MGMITVPKRKRFWKPPVGKAVLNRRHQLGDPVGCWLFNEGSGGQVFDLSGNGNVGTITGATWKPGKFGISLNFDGAADYVLINTIAAINPAKDYSIVWNMKLNGTPGADDFIFSQYASATDRFCITMQSTSLDFGHLNPNVSYDAVRHNTALASNVWYHCAAVNHSDYSKELYVNNIDDSGVGSGENPIVTGFAIGVRGSTSLSKFFDGQIDYVMIYDRVLTTQEIGLYREPFCMITTVRERAFLIVMPIGGVNYDETGRAVSVACSVSKADNQQMVDTGKDVSITAGVSKIDNQQMLDTNKEIVFAASVSETDIQQMVDTSLGITVVASLNIADAQQMVDTNKFITFAAGVNITDTQQMVDTDLGVSLGASITEIDTQQMKDLLKAITFVSSCDIETEIYYDASAAVFAMFAFILLRQHTS